MNKFNIPTAIVLAAVIIGGFFYAIQINKQKSIEKQQMIEIEQKRQEQQDKELKEQQAKEQAEQNLNTCIANAEDSYSNQWYKECKSQGLVSAKCISLKEMTFDQYAEQNNIPQEKRLESMLDFFKKQNECSCRLPLANADRINQILESDKAICFKKYPQ